MEISKMKYCFICEKKSKIYVINYAKIIVEKRKNKMNTFARYVKKMCLHNN